MKILKKRTRNWWFFTLLPLFVFFIIIFLLFLNEFPIVILLTQQLFLYSIILSGTELGIRLNINSLQENKDFWIGFAILIFSAILLPLTYLTKDFVNNYGSIFLTISIIFTLGSIWMTNQNEYGGIPDLEEQRQEQTENFSNKFKDLKGEYKEVKI